MQFPIPKNNCALWPGTTGSGCRVLLPGQPRSALASRKGVHVVRYEPPAKSSPAVAAYLLERGVSDMPLVVAIPNMAAKGYLRIEHGPNDYLLSRSNASGSLETEEEVIAEAIFSRAAVPSVRLSALFKLEKIARNVRACLESSIEPDLISPHFLWFIPGLTVSLWCFLAALYPEMEGLWKSPAGAAVVIPAFVACSRYWR